MYWKFLLLDTRRNPQLAPDFRSGSFGPILDGFNSTFWAKLFTSVPGQALAEKRTEILRPGQKRGNPTKKHVSHWVPEDYMAVYFFATTQL